MTVHPNVHAEWKEWSEQETLHVISPYFNPLRSRNRRELFHDFSYHMQHAPNVSFWPVELAYGARPFEVTDSSNPQHIQLRTTDILWYKENLINETVKRIPLPPVVGQAQYLAYFDGDVTCERHDWALEAIHQLQIFPWVQLFSSFVFHSPDHLPIHQHPSYAYIYNEYAPDPNPPGSTKQTSKGEGGYLGKPPSGFIRDRRFPGAPGLGWAFTRAGFDAVGGFLDTCIMGSADWHMALGFTGDEARGANVHDIHGSGDAYNQSIGLWQRRAFAAIKGKIGYVKQQLTHHWHGDHSKRQYQSRWKILDKNHFDPLVDLQRDSQGLLRYTGNKPQLEREMRDYMLARNDDSTEMFGKPIF